ncbi:hypothetical protein ACROYT_G021834 [Oculina patagonica]
MSICFTPSSLSTLQSTRLFLRSDNAGCYHNGPLILSLPYIGERTGVTPLRYDFSDPQAGKDICDRKTAPMKAHIRRWVNEKHDVTTADDMKQALESHGGLKGCRAAVVEVDTTKAAGMDNKIPGARSGLKADPVQVSHEMKFLKDDNGHILFTPEEWRTAPQLNSFFSRLSALQRQSQTGKSGLEDTNEEIPEEDLEALESEIALEDLRQAVLHDMDVPNHPIQVGERNICELTRAKKLNTLKVAELREICQSLQVAVDGSLARKKSFIEPLETYVKSCTCFQT